MNVNEIIRILSDIRSKYNCFDAEDEECYRGLSEAIKMLSAQQWIPCSETVYIPEHEVLCCDKYGEELIGWLSYEDDQWLCESETEMMYDPVAWMEKPKPWRGEP